MADRLPGLSVVIPHHGDPAPTVALAAGLLAQRYGGPLQVVVSDDLSPVPFPVTEGVEVVRREENGGYGAAVNSGVARAAHELLLVLNSDVVVPDGFLVDLVRGATPLMPAVVAPTIVTGGVAEPIGRRFPRARHQAVEWTTLLGRWRDSPAFERAVGQVRGPALGETLEVDWAAGVALLLPTALFREVDGFDEGYFMYAEEVDLQRRLHDRGVRTVLLGTRPLPHVGGGSSDPDRARSWLVASRLRYAEKWGGQRRLRVALSSATGVNLVVNLARRAAGRPVSPFAEAGHEWRLIWRR